MALNPTITIGAVILGLKSIPIGVVYILGQLIGAIVGYGILKVLFYYLFYYILLLLVYLSMICTPTVDNTFGGIQQRKIKLNSASASLLFIQNLAACKVY